ncbi:hypothetical protein CEE45_17100, partial [Candidatus Heimdallarchaeota archaeon B3_Heim]
PEAKYDRDIQVKSVAGIIKFAAAANAPIIPIAVTKEKTKLFNLISIDGIKVKVSNPIPVSNKLNREKFRDQRYELAEDIVNIIDSLKYTPSEEDEE